MTQEVKKDLMRQLIALGLQRFYNGIGNDSQETRGKGE